MCKIDDRYNVMLLGLCCRCKKKKTIPAHSCEMYPKQNGIPAEIWRGDMKECPYFQSKQ